MRQINGDSKVTRMARKRKRCVAPFSTFKPREIADNQVGCVDYFRKRRRESSRRLGSRFDSPVGPRFNKACPPSPAAAISKPKTNAGTSITATSESARSPSASAFPLLKTRGAGRAASIRAAIPESAPTARPRPSTRRAPISRKHGASSCQTGPKPIFRNGAHTGPHRVEISNVGHRPSTSDAGHEWPVDLLLRRRPDDRQRARSCPFRASGNGLTPPKYNAAQAVQ
jgi:hypothetical protein